MKLSSIEPHILREGVEEDPVIEAQKIELPLEVHKISPQTSSNYEEAPDPLIQNLRQEHIIDFVAKARKKKAEVLGKKRFRAIRSYQSISSFEDSFIYKGRFYRSA